jgi:hypothetical protein
MSQQLKMYWQQVRDVEARLPQDVFLTSIEDRFTGRAGGVVCEVDRASAARCVVDGSHRVATEEEIEAYRLDQDERKRAGQAAALLAQGRTVVQLPPSSTRKKAR